MGKTASRSFLVPGDAGSQQAPRPPAAPGPHSRTNLALFIRVPGRWRGREKPPAHCPPCRSAHAQCRHLLLAGAGPGSALPPLSGRQTPIYNSSYTSWTIQQSLPTAHHRTEHSGGETPAPRLCVTPFFPCTAKQQVPAGWRCR